MDHALVPQRDSQFSQFYCPGDITVELIKCRNFLSYDCKHKNKNLHSPRAIFASTIDDCLTANALKMVQIHTSISSWKDGLPNLCLEKFLTCIDPSQRFANQETTQYKASWCVATTTATRLFYYALTSQLKKKRKTLNGSISSSQASTPVGSDSHCFFLCLLGYVCLYLDPPRIMFLQQHMHGHLYKEWTQRIIPISTTCVSICFILRGLLLGLDLTALSWQEREMS